MAKCRIVIADKDEIGYLSPLESRFLEIGSEQIEVESISDENYLDEYFSKPRKLDALVINEELFKQEYQKHDIKNLFILCEDYDNTQKTENLKAKYIDKYTNTKEVIGAIVASLNIDWGHSGESKRRLISIISPIGGVGTTTVAIGLCASLSQIGYKALFISSSPLQEFGHFFAENRHLSSEVSIDIGGNDPSIIDNIESIVGGDDNLKYLLPLEGSLVAAGISQSNITFLAQSCFATGKFDYVIVDGANYFSKPQIELMQKSSQVVVVVAQDNNSCRTLKAFLDNVDTTDRNKYIFCANKFSKQKPSSLNEVLSGGAGFYIENVPCEQLETVELLQKVKDFGELAYQFI